VVLVSSDGVTDAPTRIKGAAAILQSDAVEMWYAQNVVQKHPKLKSIPLGLAIHDGFDGSPNSKHTLEVMRSLKALPNSERKLKVLHDPGTIEGNGRRGIHRRRALEQLKGGPHIVLMNRTSRLSCWNFYKEYSFATAVTGVGWDTHRLWELFYFGTIPIVEREPLSQSFEGAHLV
jgi:hypothetical protein